ncbi:unnamed protein product [Darwinula stevensoni]|uniref:G-protein coupled receptors family 1 profile domain-containing protein n=1 Tax=Darwinula stevensoni TaxID=69355 RepID=A0A7R9A938_9CRUS|nr:unnamed protein product [Darwinula stevensoni]CAG0897033.1 unnamed protein product [Darwinula stevensoni]
MNFTCASCRHRCLRKTATVFVLNLAAADLGNSLMHSMASYSSFKHGWQFGNIGCRFYAGMVGLFGLVSIMTLSAIAVERCLVIAPPSSKFPKLTPRIAKKVCFGIWFYSLALVIPPYLGWSDYVPEAFLTSCTWDFYTRTLINRAYYIFLLFFGFVVPISIIFVSYLSILRMFRQVKKETAEAMETEGEPKQGEAQKRTEFWVAKIIFTLIVLFLVSWTPYTIVSFIAIFGDIELITPWVSAAPVVFAKASVVYNPIVYGISHPAFRFNLRRRLIKILSANMTEDGKEDFPPSSSDESRLRRCNARRFSHESSTVRTDRILSSSGDYRREASSSGHDPVASCHGNGSNRSHGGKNMRFGGRDRQPSTKSPSGREGKNNPQTKREEDSVMIGDNYILVNCVENGQAVIRISKREGHQEDLTPGVLDSNQLLLMLLNALQRNENPHTVNAPVTDAGIEALDRDS